MSGKVIILTFENMRLSQDGSGRLTVRFDSAHKSVNLLNTAMWQDLDLLLESVERDPSVEQLVFRSDKSSSFLAGWGGECSGCPNGSGSDRLWNFCCKGVASAAMRQDRWE